MSISEDRLQLLLSRDLKRAVQEKSRRMGISVGEYVRQLLEKDIGEGSQTGSHNPFPFGEAPIHTGRTHGSVEHDRPAKSAGSK